MRYSPWLLMIPLTTLIAGCERDGSSGSNASQEESRWQKLADDAKWTWNDDQNSAELSAKNAPAIYKVEIVKKDFSDVSIHFARQGKQLYQIDGHVRTVFVVSDGILYYADFDSHDTGCTLIAFDLENGKQQWNTALKALGPIGHDKYRSEVSLEFVDGALRVLGHESAGDYLEFVDPQTGKTVGHRVFRLDWTNH